MHKKEPRKFYDRSHAEDILKFYGGYMVYDGNNDERGREYWLVGTKITSVNQEIHYL